MKYLVVWRGVALAKMPAKEGEGSFLVHCSEVETLPLTGSKGSDVDVLRRRTYSCTELLRRANPDRKPNANGD